jgi:hypothetical protein
LTIQEEPVSGELYGPSLLFYRGTTFAASRHNFLASS